MREREHIVTTSEALRITERALRRVAHIPCEQPNGAHCTMIQDYIARMCPWCEVREVIRAVEPFVPRPCGCTSSRECEGHRA
jgi:hypothetical protein